jgi:hypothetical protein
MPRKLQATLNESHNAGWHPRVGSILYRAGVIAEGEFETLCLMRGDTIVARVAALPFNSVPPLDPEVLEALPTQLRHGSGRAVSARVMGQARRVLLLLCLAGGEAGGASALLKRLLGESDEQFALRLGSNSATADLARSPGGRSSGLIRRLWQVAAHEVFDLELPRGRRLPPLRSGPSEVTGDLLEIRFDLGVRWLDELSEAMPRSAL